MTRRASQAKALNPPVAFCEGKAGFQTWAAADRSIQRKAGVQRLRGDRIVPLSIYRCPKCGHFHVAGAT